MAVDPKYCTVSKCPTIIDEMALTNGGNFYLYNQWVAAYRAGTTTQCQAHYFGGAGATAYAAFIKGASHRGNREKS